MIIHKLMTTMALIALSMFPACKPETNDVTLSDAEYLVCSSDGIGLASVARRLGIQDPLANLGIEFIDDRYSWTDLVLSEVDDDQLAAVTVTFLRTEGGTRACKALYALRGD